MILAGDIGGTHCRFALYADKTAVQTRQPYALEYFPMASYAYTGGWQMAVNTFLDTTQSPLPAPITSVCFALAGPVTETLASGRCCTLTNVAAGWTLSDQDLAALFALEISQVRLINDMEAIAYAIPLLQPDELALLNPTQAVPKLGNRALIAAGTGLGELMMVWQRQHNTYLPVASEGGHVDFAPCDAQQLALWQQLRAKFGCVNYEHVLSGTGLVRSYQVLWQQQFDVSSRGNPVTALLDDGQDPAPYITASALDGRDPVSLATVQLFMDIYGAEAGNMALKYLAVNGVFIGGGIALKLWQHPHGKPLFARWVTAFQRKHSSYAALMAEVPLRLILNAEVGLLGAAWCVAENDG